MKRGNRSGLGRGHSRLLDVLLGVASIVWSVSSPRVFVAAEPPDPLAFPRPLSPDLPFDVDIERLRVLVRENKIPEAQRLFDIFAWQAFIALNWPALPDGSPDWTKTIADSTAPRVWMGWRANESVFKPDGSRLEPWDSAREIAVKDHYLWRFSKMLNERRSSANELTPYVTLADFLQAFTGPLVDLNGEFVRYESYLNKPQFDYIVSNELHNQEGQVELVATRLCLKIGRTYT
jgi:hypothetical protein